MSSRFAFWQNDRKTEAKHPDARGHIEITCALVQELAAAMAAGQGMTQNQQGEWIFKLDAAAWRGTSPEPRMPVISGQVSTLAATQEQARKLAEWKAQQQGNGGGNGFWGGAPAAPQQAAPAPQAPPQYQQPPAPAAAPPASPAPPQTPPMPPAPAAPAAPASAAAPGWGGGWGQSPGI